MKLPLGIETKIERTEWGWFIHSHITVGSTVRIHARGTAYGYRVPDLTAATILACCRERRK